MSKDIYKKMKKESVQQKQSTKREDKKEKKLRKKIRATFEWIDVEEVSDEGIYLRNKNVLRGVEIIPGYFYLEDLALKTQEIERFSSVLNEYPHRIYWNFVQREPRLDEVYNDLLNRYETEDNPSRKRLLQLELDKVMRFENNNREISFYLVIQEDEKDIDELYQRFVLQLKKVFDLRKMDIRDYRTFIYSEFENSMVMDYYFPRLSTYDELTEEDD